MMRIQNQNVTFELQARTDLATNENGTSINATIFSAFAAKDQTGATIQVELADDRNSKKSSLKEIVFRLRYFIHYLCIIKANNLWD